MYEQESRRICILFGTLAEELLPANAIKIIRAKDNILCDLTVLIDGFHARARNLKAMETLALFNHQLLNGLIYANTAH